MNGNQEPADTARISECLQRIADGIRDLKAMGVIRSRKFLSDFGEWFVATVYNGCLAEGTTQEGWDVMVAEQKVQVKTHSKGPDNPNHWSAVKDPDKFDVLVVLVLDEQYKIRAMYRATKEDLQGVLKRCSDGPRIYWGDMEPWRITKETVPQPDRFSAFFA